MFNTAGLYVAGALALAAGGFYIYHLTVVKAQAAQISTLEASNKQLRNDVDTAVNANKTMQAQVDSLALQSQQLVSILQKAQQKDVAVAEWFNQARNDLSTGASSAKVAEKLKDNPAAVIDEANAEIECTIANLGKLGTCTGGKFVPFEGPRQ